MARMPNTTPSTDPDKNPARDNIGAIARMEQVALEERSAGERLGDAVATAMGSVSFLLFHTIWFSLWVAINLGWIPGVRPFDPFPFSFLTLVVSLEAIFLSIFLLISQNRLSRQANNRSHLHLQIDLLAEQEMTAMLQVLQSITKHLGIGVEVPSEVDPMLEKTDVDKLAKDLKKELPKG